MSTGGSKKKRLWREEKDRLLSMTQTERRKELCKDYIPLDNIQSLLKEQQSSAYEDENTKISSLCDKVSLYKGDITQLEVDAIVNAVVKDTHLFCRKLLLKKLHGQKNLGDISLNEVEADALTALEDLLKEQQPDSLVNFFTSMTTVGIWAV